MLTISILFLLIRDSENFMYFNLDLVNLRVLSMKLAESLCRIFFFKSWLASYCRFSTVFCYLAFLQFYISF